MRYIVGSPRPTSPIWGWFNGDDLPFFSPLAASLKVLFTISHALSDASAQAAMTMFLRPRYAMTWVKRGGVPLRFGKITALSMSQLGDGAPVGDVHLPSLAFLSFLFYLILSFRGPRNSCWHWPKEKPRSNEDFGNRKNGGKPNQDLNYKKLQVIINERNQQTAPCLSCLNVCESHPSE